MPRQRIGLPLVLGMYENLPFWTALLVTLGHEVVLSGGTDSTMIEQAIDTLCSESVCLPARIASSHIVQLAKLKVDRIFFPNVVYETGRTKAKHSFNCPIVTGYPEVVAGTVASTLRQQIPMATPPVSFEDPKALRRTARRALAEAGIDAPGFEEAFDYALMEYQRFQQQRERLGKTAIENARIHQRESSRAGNARGFGLRRALLPVSAVVAGRRRALANPRSMGIPASRDRSR
jgi:predicted nucleotide-binding protein (sugar kinase/HSP70/actin superfamily)